MSADNKAGLYAKMAAVMGELSNIPKGGWNDHFKYKFVTADDVADKVRELLAAKGIAFFASIVGRELMEVRKGSEKTDPKTGEVTRLVTTSARWVVNFEFTFADGEGGSTWTSTWTAEADSADDKGINKCATAAEKYFLLKTFIVSSADEPDADADGGKKRQQAPQNARNGQAPPQQQQNAPERTTSPKTGNGASPSTSIPPTSPTNGDGSDPFAKQFPASGKWTRDMLFDATHDYFSAREHFDFHWNKHEAEYGGLTLEETATLVRAAHWNYDKDRATALVNWAKSDLDMSVANVMQALTDASPHSVKKLRDWDSGTYADAQEACRVWAQQEAAKDIEREAAGK